MFNDEERNDVQKYRSNYIRTTKYTVFSFLPVGLAYQFLRFSNCYFLLVTILACIPSVTPVSPLTAIGPFVFVLGVSMLREAFEDITRYKSDKGKYNMIQGNHSWLKDQICFTKSWHFLFVLSNYIFEFAIYLTSSLKFICCHLQNKIPVVSRCSRRILISLK